MVILREGGRWGWREWKGKSEWRGKSERKREEEAIKRYTCNGCSYTCRVVVRE